MRIADLKVPGFFNGTIHCRVTCKRPMRTFPDGHVISVDLKDESGEIRAVAFNNEATRMDQLLRLNRVYRIETFKLQTKRDQYSQSPHDLEILFEPRSVVTPMTDGGSLPRKKYHFVELSSVLGLELKSFVDVIGVVLFTGELEEYMHEDDGQTSDMRFVTLIDQSGFTIKARLWDRLARDFNGSDHPVLAFSSIVISPPTNKHGPSRFLDTKVQTSILPENPNFPETRTLRKWFSANKDVLLTEDSRMDDSKISTSSSDVEDIQSQVKESVAELPRMDDSFLSTSSFGVDSEEIQRIVEDSLKNSAVKVQVAKCIFLGPPEVGKTQLKLALLGDFKEVKESTNVSTRATPAVEIFVASSASASKKWEAFRPAHLNNWSMNESSGIVKKCWASPPCTRLSSHQSSSVDSRSRVAKSLPSPMKSRKPAVAGERDTSKSASKTCYGKISQTILKSITAAQSLHHSKESLEFKLVYIVDNGGQPSFLDFHSVTATFAASYVLLFDASKGLDAFPEMTLRKTELPIRNMPPSIYSNFDLLRRSLLTVHLFSRRFGKKHQMIKSLMKNSFQPAKSPHVLIVGTHKDDSLESKRFAEKARLDSTCESIPSLKHQYDIHFVDSLNQQCEELSDVRDTLSQKDNICKFDLPLSWFQVYLMSLSVGSDENLQTLKYDDLCENCLQHNHVQSSEEFKAMITVMHSLGVFYIAELEQPSLFKGDFNDVLIFVDPNLLFDYLSRILAIPFREPSSISCSVLRELQNLGELTSDCLAELDIPDTLGTLPGFHKKLLGWLVNWRLAAKKDGMDQWFIPSVLPPRPKEISPFVPSGCFKNVFPLYFTFQPEDTTSNRSFHYLPAGFFPHLVVHLMQTEHFFLPENSTNDQTGYPSRCRDSIVLSERGGMKYTLNICLVDESDRLAVYMWPGCQPLSSDPSALYHAGAVLADLKEYMVQTNERLFCTSIGTHGIALCSACRCKPSSPQSSSQVVQHAPIHLDKVCLDDNREACLQCLSHSGLGASIHGVDDDSLANVLRGFSGPAQDSPRTINFKRRLGERSHSEPSPSKTKKPQAKRSATCQGQPKRLQRQKCTQGMDEKIHSALDILRVPEYGKGLIGRMKSLGAVLDIGDKAIAIVNTPGSMDDHLLEILDRYIAEKSPTWRDFCKALKTLDCFNNLRAKITEGRS